jgi:sulfonate transport system permease protein
MTVATSGWIPERRSFLELWRTSIGLRWNPYRGRVPTSKPLPLWWRAVGGAIVPLALIVVWWIVSAAGIVGPDRLPSPPAVAVAGVELARRGLLVVDLGASVQRVLPGVALGSAAGLALGILVGLSRTARVLLSPFLTALRAVPTLAWLPLLLLYLGIGEPAKVVLIGIGAALPVFATLSNALQAGAGDTRRARNTVPVAVGALRLALAQSWLFMVAAEILSATTGLGFLLIQSSAAGRIDRLFLTIILLAVLARSTDGILGLVEWTLRRPRR